MATSLSQEDINFLRLAGSSKVSSAMFDVSLMVCLLRHFTDLDIHDTLPMESIHTEAADICRIKFYRNSIVHSDIQIQLRTLNDWRDTDEKYIPTSATTFILQSLNQTTGVIITGSPGCGKSAVAHHVALELEKEKYEIIPCDDSSKSLSILQKINSSLCN
ncbi:unnamed protein product [Mytilus edulis]|uniref:Uncharacterized protein n=1 Tax=Mytilus edulis TaxID=6550 RepID=A0A8S3S7X4_MYTED|nr:unnamed protein product [Mytilus edulis]